MVYDRLTKKLFMGPRMHSESYDEYIEYRRHVFFLKIGSRAGGVVMEFLIVFCGEKAVLHSWIHATAKIDSY